MPGQLALERSALIACWLAALWLGACHLDRNPGQGPAMHLRDSSASERRRDAGTHDASDVDAASSDPRVRYEVPPAGGMVVVTPASGHPIAFGFPPSARGLSVVLTPLASELPGWPAAQFSDAVQMEPDGQQFDEPVLVAPSSADVLLMTLATTDALPEGLPFDPAHRAFELRHFSTLVVMAPESSCGNRSGWHEQRDAAQCEGFGSTRSYVEFECAANPICQQITAHCCAPPSAKFCRPDNPNLVVAYSAQSKTANAMFALCTNPPVAGASTPDGGRSFSTEDAGPGAP
jgi:hypothetical protein